MVSMPKHGTVTKKFVSGFKMVGNLETTSFFLKDPNDSYVQIAMAGMLYTDAISQPGFGAYPYHN